MAGLDGAWLEPTKRSAAARRLVFPAGGDRGEVWAPPFRLMAALTIRGGVRASGAALELPLAAWSVASGTGEGTAAAWTVDLQRAGLGRDAGAGALASALSEDGARLLVVSPGREFRALFATRGGRFTVEAAPGVVAVRCEAAGDQTIVAIGAFDQADLARTLEHLARRGLAGLARQRTGHDEQVLRGGAALAAPDDPVAAARFEAAKLEADAMLLELAGIGRAPLSRAAAGEGGPGVLQTRHACRTALGLLAAGLRDPARDTLRFLASCTGASVPAAISVSGDITEGGRDDALHFIHLARRHLAWTADASLQDELAAAVGVAEALAGSGQDDAADLGDSGTRPADPGAGEVLRAVIEDEWGIEPDAPNVAVRLRPRLPAGRGRAGLSRLRIGRTILDLRLRQRGAVTQIAFRKVMGPAIAVDCELPGVPVDAAELDGVVLGSARARFEASGEHELILHGPG